MCNISKEDKKERQNKGAKKQREVALMQKVQMNNLKKNFFIL